MGVDHTSDDDMEKLIEFDELDFDTCKKPASSNSRRISGSYDEVGLTPSDPKVARCYISSQLQAYHDKQTTEDCRVLRADDDSGKTSNRSLETVGITRPAANRLEDKESRFLTISGKHSVVFSSRKRERALTEAASGDRARSFPSTGNDNLDHMSSKGIVTRALSRAGNGSNNEVGEKDLTEELFGVARDERAGQAENLGRRSSQATSAHACKGLRQDLSAECGRFRNDPTQMEKFTQRGIDCTRGEAPISESRHAEKSSLDAVQSLFSREISAAQEAEEDRNCRHFSGMELPNQESEFSAEGDKSLSPRGLAYRIPGPAGALQCFTMKFQTTARLCQEDSGTPGKSSWAADVVDFKESPWLAAMEAISHVGLNSGKHRPTSIIAIKATKRHIPQLVALIKTVTPSGFGDCSVTLKDPTGTIMGSIHRTVLTNLEDGRLIAPGAVIILKKVSVFSPTPHCHYLNITINNVDQIFGKDTLNPTGREINNDNSKRQTTGLNHALYNSTHVEECSTYQKSPGSGTKGKESPSLARKLKGAGDSDKYATGDKQVLEASTIKNGLIDVRGVGKASPEAMAKVAGWDLDEDFESLLDDDFGFLP